MINFVLGYAIGQTLTIGLFYLGFKKVENKKDEE